ncbi:MAG: hypothetical protein M3288_01680 [Thermoproteota archaeon]|nr:hypothetical protein [Thermoproteota archaeon]
MTNPFNLEPHEGEKIWITGDTVIIRATAAETGGAYTMIEAPAPPLDTEEIARSEVAGRRYGLEVVDWGH